MMWIEKLSNWIWGTSEPSKIIKVYCCTCGYCKRCKYILNQKK